MVTLLMASAVITGFIVTQFSAGEHRISAWWPPIGLAVSAAIVTTRRKQWIIISIVFLSTVLASLAAQRSLSVAIAGAIGVAAQCWLVRRFAVDDQDQPQLFSLRDVGRLAVGAVLGAMTIGAMIFGARLMESGNEIAFGAATQVAAGTTSAIALIVPFFLVGRQRHSRLNPWSASVSYALTILASVLSFSLSQTQALVFLPLPFLVWAALSLSMSSALVQVLLVNCIALMSTSAGGGPFASAGGPLSPAALLEIYVVANTAMCLFAAAARNERNQRSEQYAAAVSLLKQGFSRTGTGYVVLRSQGRGTFAVLDFNCAAVDLMPSSLSVANGRAFLQVGSELHSMCLSASRSHAPIRADVKDRGSVSVSVEQSSVSIYGRVLLVTTTDLSAIEAAAIAADERVRQERETSDRLRLVNQKHDLFVASVTHELSTPLTSIIGYTEEALEAATDNTQRGHLLVVQRNAERLLLLVRDILTVTKGLNHDNQTTIVDVTRIIFETVEDLARKARDRGVEISQTTPAGLLATGTELRVRQALTNLLSNALKFSDPGTCVVIEACREPGWIIVTITDTGCGMSDEEIAHAFDRFYRAKKSVAQGIPGTGLGLGIARDAVEADGGTLTLRNNIPHGIVACVKMPEANYTR